MKADTGHTAMHRRKALSLNASASGNIEEQHNLECYKRGCIYMVKSTSKF